MSTIEMLQAQVAALINRVQKLEIEFGRMSALHGDDAEAQAMAQHLGFTPAVFVARGRKWAAKRRRLSAELRARDWSIDRIARAFKCSPRTVNRNFRR